MVVVFFVVMKEWENIYEFGGGFLFVEDCLSWMMFVMIIKEFGCVECNLFIFVIIGLVVLFIGLFGIVWGIMNFF